LGFRALLRAFLLSRFSRRKSIPAPFSAAILDYYTTNIRGSQAAFSASPECVYITEPANSNFAKIPDSTPNIVPLDSAFFGFNTAGFQQGKWVCLSSSIPAALFRAGLFAAGYTTASCLNSGLSVRLPPDVKRGKIMNVRNYQEGG
jgi:hypothetical protein